jgi:polysaccharide biosynthesis/export protein
MKVYVDKCLIVLSGRISLFLLGCCLTILVSCNSTKRIAYFQDIPDSIAKDGKLIKSSAFADPVIQPNDILQVSILTLDPGNDNTNTLGNANASTYSVQPSSSNSTAVAQGVPGFLVDKNGYIELPIVGRVKVAGLTTAVARDTIYNRVEEFNQTPVVNVRFANFNITVLGEVNRPAIYTVPNEKVSILDAIGMAGDLTIYGKRNNILLIRDSVGHKQFVRFDLNKSESFTSRYFYMRQGDVLYVEPNKAKINAMDATRTRNFAIAASALSVLIILLSRINF